jgi:hypothetical protein
MSDYVRVYIETQEEIIKIPLKQIRELGGLPKSVETVAIMPPPITEPWDAQQQFLYLRVKTPWSPIRRPNEHVTYSNWDGFLNNIVGFMRREADELDSIQIRRQ